MFTIDANSLPDVRKILVHDIYDGWSSFDITLSPARSQEEKKDEEK